MTTELLGGYILVCLYFPFFPSIRGTSPPTPLIKAVPSQRCKKVGLCLNLMYDHHHIIDKQMVDKIHTILYFPVGYTACYCLRSNAISIFLKKKITLNLRSLYLV